MTRPIEAIELRGVTLEPIDTALPVFVMGDPRELRIDEAYQRSITERSIKLIRKLAATWNWRKYVPPLVVEVDGEYHVIDGQHQAIAAASRGDIAEMPLMLVEAPEQADLADAFVGRNRDRLAVTRMQLHFAAVEAKNEDAMTIAQVCWRAGVVLVRQQPAAGKWKPGETMAIGSIEGLIKRRYAIGARKVLEIIVGAGMAPVTADQIKAVEALLFDEQYKGKVDGPAITATLRAVGSIRLERDAAAYVAIAPCRMWIALAKVLFNACVARWKD